jgi:solute carrier family 29 (equilibrative nucleoside transporter), member 1/2/3
MNTSDFIGRAIPGVSPQYLTIHNPRILVTLVILRIFFWPLFWACNISNQGPWIPLFGDTTFFVIVGLFGLSNGWVATCLMMEAGMYVPIHEREKANSLMSFCLCIGYLFCSKFLIDLVWRWEVFYLLPFLHHLYGLSRLFMGCIGE